MQPNLTPEPTLRALVQHLRQDDTALRLLAELLLHLDPRLADFVPPAVREQRRAA